MEHVITG